jgi:hypothetical protein
MTSQMCAPCWPALLFGIGAGHDGEEMGAVGVGDEPLGSVEHVDVAVAPGGGAHRSAVRARLRLGEGEGGDRFAGGNAGQPLLLLRLVAEHDEALAADADIGADGRAESRAGVAELHGHQAFLLHG